MKAGLKFKFVARKGSQLIAADSPIIASIPMFLCLTDLCLEIRLLFHKSLKFPKTGSNLNIGYE